MIDLIQSFDSVESKIREFVSGKAAHYFDSQCYRLLRTRNDKLTESYDMKYAGRAGSISKVAFPLLLERKVMLSSVLNASCRADPTISVEPIEDTSQENARNAEDTINQNLKTTRYRMRTLRPIVDFACGYGSCIQFSDFRAQSKQVWRTTATQIGPQRKQITSEAYNVFNSFIHPLNYYQDPACADFHDSAYKGHIERITLAELYSRYVSDTGNYIKANMEKALRKLQKSGQQSRYYFSGNQEQAGNQDIDLQHYWGPISIGGNEESETCYYCQIVAGEIIRFQDNPIDDGIIPYAIFGIKRRSDYWWYNTDVEFVRPHEQFTNLVMNMKADNLLNDMMRYVFYQKGAINLDDLNNRVAQGGFVSVDLQGNGVTSISQLIQQFSPVDTSTGAADWLMRQVNENKQSMSTKPDYTRQANQGGLQNKTATAATMIQSEADMREGDIMDTFSEGLIDTGEINFTMLQQFLPDRFNLRPRPNMPPREIWKEEMMGRYAFVFQSALQKNKIIRATQIANGITMLVNFQSRIQQLQGINFVKPVRELIRTLDIGNVDEILQEAPQMPGQPMTPGIPAPGPAAGMEVIPGNNMAETQEAMSEMVA